MDRKRDLHGGKSKTYLPQSGGHEPPELLGKQEASGERNFRIDLEKRKTILTGVPYRDLTLFTRGIFPTALLPSPALSGSVPFAFHRIFPREDRPRDIDREVPTDI